MAYCSASDVRILIDTKLDDEVIENIIAISDVDLDRKLGGTTLEVELKKKCSMLLTAAVIAEKGPSTYAVGNIRIDMGKKGKNWLAQVDEYVAEAKAGSAIIKSSVYQKIDEDVRYSVEE